MRKKEKVCLILVTVLGVALVLLSILDLAIDLTSPGLQPLLASLFWLLLWQLFRIRDAFPGGIWTFVYLFIVLMNAAAGISQIITALR